jgi:hypothetical protein
VRRSDALKRLGFTGFHEWSCESNSIPKEISGRVVWNVISSGKRSTLFKFLFLKWLHDELTTSELKYVLNLPEFFSSSGKEFLACMRMQACGFLKTEIRTRLNTYRQLIGIKPHTAEIYRSMKQIKYFLQEKEFRVPPTKKFSGWVRHQNDQGNLGQERLYGPEFNPGYVGEEVDLFSLLSVGKVLIAGATVTLSPMIEPKKVRNGRNQNKNLIHS